MGEQDFVFGVLEMSVIAVTCCKCLNGITFNAGNGDTGLPEECPVCHTDLRNAGELLGQYRRFYNGVQNSKHTFEFRVRMKK
ncbi:MAG: hypothetical protein ACLPXT_03660 [Terracidiphilus sp.]